MVRIILLALAEYRSQLTQKKAAIYIEKAEWPEGKDCRLFLISFATWSLPIHVYSVIKLKMKVKV